MMTQTILQSDKVTQKCRDRNKTTKNMVFSVRKNTHHGGIGEANTNRANTKNSVDRMIVIGTERTSKTTI